MGISKPGHLSKRGLGVGNCLRTATGTTQKDGCPVDLKLQRDAHRPQSAVLEDGAKDLSGGERSILDRQLRQVVANLGLTIIGHRRRGAGSEDSDFDPVPPPK